MTWIYATTLVILLTTGGLIVYDFFAGFNGGYDATLSYHVLTWSLAHPVITLAAGILIGHLFWPQSAKWDGLTYPAVVLGVGILLGHLFWSQ